MKIALATVVFGGVLIINLAQILSPGRWPGSGSRRAGRHAVPAPPHELLWNKDETPSLSARATLWFRWWRSCPRPPLRPWHWLPHHGFLFLPTLLGLALVIGGAEVLLGPGQTFRLGGLLAFLAGLPTMTLIVLYVLRPVDHRLRRAASD